jgi:hypothetical protein
MQDARRAIEGDMLSVKLRLTNSSHRNETFHERKLRTTPDGPRPWEQH